MAEVSPEIQAAWETLHRAQSLMRAEGIAAGAPGLLQAAQGFRRAADRAAESYAFELLASIHHELGHFQKAAEYHRAGLQAARSLTKPGTRVVSHLDGLAMALSNMGSWQEAEQVYRQALEETHKPVRDLRELRARILKHLGDVYARYAARPEEAIRLYDEAIAISGDYDDRFNIAASLNFKGQALEQLQRSEEALHLYEQARLLAEEINATSLLAACYSHLGQAYLHLNRLPLARQYIEQALSLDRQCGNQQGVCRDLFFLGRIQNSQRDDEAALATLRDAFLIAREIHDLILAMHILLELARLSERRLQGGRAKDYLEQALAYSRELGDRRAEAEINTFQASYEGQSELIPRLEEAVADARAQGSRGLEEDLQMSLARQREKLGDLIKAREHYLRAAELLEEMRTGYRAEEHLRAFSETSAACYDRLVEISLQFREDTDAFVWAERSRARVLQIMQQNRDVRAAAWMSQESRRQYLQLCDEIIKLDLQVQRLERAGESVSQELREQLQQALLGEADFALSSRRAREFLQGEIRRPEIKPEELTKCLKSLPLRVLALSYYVGGSGLYVFCFTGEAFYVRELGGGPEEVRDKVRRFRESIGVPEVDVRDVTSADDGLTRDPVMARAGVASSDYVSHSRALYDLLLRPLEAELAAAEHICIIPHGSLHFLPFHALHDGERYLVERLPVSYAPTATILVESLRGGNLTIRRALALGDPDSDLSPLSNAREEVAKVRELLGAERCRKEVGAQATRALVLESGNRSDGGAREDVWHFAMHAMFVQSAPHLSYLQLSRDGSDDGRLFAYEIAALERVAPLNVMSACRTAMTREARGDELSGLLFSFLVAGARTVLATLWSVADDSTADLMAEFYRYVGSGKFSLAEALQRAQLALLRHPATSSPHHWAAVTLHCNWNPVSAPAGVTLAVEEAQAPWEFVPALPVEVLLRQGDSLIGRARFEHERQRWSLLPEAEKDALFEAIKMYSEVLREEPNHARALRQRGVAYFSLLKFEDAEADLLKVCGLADDDVVALAVLGLIYADRKENRNAVKYLKRAFQINPRLELEYPPRRTYWLRNPLDCCRATLTVEECTRKLAEAPHDSNIYTERGQAYWLLSIKGEDRQENLSKASADFERALVLDPQNALALVRKTWVESLGFGSSEVYARASKMAPNNAEIHMRLAQSLGKDQSRRAIVEIYRALGCDPSIEHAYCRLAQRYLDDGDLRQALEAFEEETKRDPNCFDSYLYLSEIYAAMGRTADARHSILESVRTTHHTPYQGGPGVSLLDEIIDAIRDLARRMRAAEETSDSPLTLTELTSLFNEANAAARKGRSDEAAEIYTEILRRDPNSARAYAFRGGCYAALKEYGKAIGDLVKATELNPDNADAWFNLSSVYFNQMRYAESQAALEKARMLNPEMVRRKEEENKLRRPPAQRVPFDLDKALEAAYRESTIRCAHCQRPLRRSLETQFKVMEEDKERVKEGVPYFCHLCGVNSCYGCAVVDDSAVKCSQCFAEMEEWGEAKQTAAGRPTAVAEEPPSGSCLVCTQSGPLRNGLCLLCYMASSQAVSALNYEGVTSVECGQCGERVPVQFAEVFATGGGDLECRACFAARVARYKQPH
jgi:CHAT domain-containing protein/tetratricopeptide (TPR) repeat protein